MFGINPSSPEKGFTRGVESTSAFDVALVPVLPTCPQGSNPWDPSPRLVVYSPRPGQEKVEWSRMTGANVQRHLAIQQQSSGPSLLLEAIRRRR